MYSKHKGQLRQWVSGTTTRDNIKDQTIKNKQETNQRDQTTPHNKQLQLQQPHIYHSHQQDCKRNNIHNKTSHTKCMVGKKQRPNDSKMSSSEPKETYAYLLKPDSRTHLKTKHGSTSLTPHSQTSYYSNTTDREIGKEEE